MTDENFKTLDEQFSRAIKSLHKPNSNSHEGDLKMKLFRSATIAVALLIPLGLAEATTNTPPPPHLV